MNSALYFGSLRHRRYAPRAHAFRYRTFMTYLDLAELDEVFRGRWLWSAHRPTLAWMRRADYLGDARMPLDEAVRERVARETGERPRGPIRLLTHLRMLGTCFNPVSFYYCFDEPGKRVETIVAEITSTPWNERHAYVLTAGGMGVSKFILKKAFHVSPFMPMNIDYEWRFTTPGERLGVHMQNHRDGRPVFDATLALERREIGSASLAAALTRFPAVGLQVLGAIYWQALRLALLRTPFYAHP
ncbi:MAG TPA: DUF1365 domain-containing protein [Burkholderiales bacterium]|nr:DUF1365 domain-containing protein [Burkholderiales bacterium]